MEELKCLYCEATLEEDDCYDMTIWDNGTVVRYMNGYCHVCGKTYQWREHYKLTKYSNLEEV